MRKRLLCVWLPDWPIQRLRVAPPTPDAAPNGSQPSGSHLPGAINAWAKATPNGVTSGRSTPLGSTSVPIVLWYQDPRRGRLVISRDAEAARLGVRIGMSIAEASEMVCRGELTPKIQQHDPRSDNEALANVAAMLLEEISPLVAIESLEKAKWAGQDLHQPQSVICDVTGIAHLFGGEAGLLDETARLLAEMGYHARLAIADSLGAAWALAHYAKADRAVSELPNSNDLQTSLSRREGEGKLHDLFMIAPVGDTLAWLKPLPVEALRIMPDTVATLARLGVYSIDSLLRLPRSGLATRLGQPLVHRIAQALGETDEPMTVFRPPAEFSSTHELDYASDDRRILEDRIRRLVANVRGGLATSGRGALRLTCRLDLSARPPLTLDSGKSESESPQPASSVTLEVNLFAPTQDVDHLSRLLVSALENKSLPATVVRLSLAVTLSSPIRSTQASLFAHDRNDGHCNSWTHHQSTARLIDSLSERLGRERVLGIYLRNDPLPEKSFRTTVLTGKSKLPQSTSRTSNLRRVSVIDRSAPIKQKNQRRPISLLTQPVEIGMTATGSPNQPPETFRHSGRMHTVLRFWGPERIETGWWYGPCIRRDYYRVETDAGWWWIYRDLTTQHWMLHGRFA